MLKIMIYYTFVDSFYTFLNKTIVIHSQYNTKYVILKIGIMWPNC